jgi:hypothetical protein
MNLNEKSMELMVYGCVYAIMACALIALRFMA